MVSSQDHKRVFDGDRGPNTGGMGAFSPSKIYDSELAGRCMKEIYLPTMNAMRESGIKFKGVLYFGLIITREGPKVLEYNARFGDPEAQVVIPRLKNDLFDIFDAIIDERLDTVKIEWNDNVAVCVVMASGGYPGKYKTGCRIDGIEEAGKDPQITVFHAGTIFRDGHFYTNGGRVLGVTAMDINLKEARKRAYEAVAKIHFDDAHYRKEIAL
jgi:phosphoribosylamine--glycine ligase